MEKTLDDVARGIADGWLEQGARPAALLTSFEAGDLPTPEDLAWAGEELGRPVRRTELGELEARASGYLRARLA